MSSFDDAFEFTDGNHNKIDIYGMSFDVKFVIRGDNTVKCITYTAKEAKDISENTLVELSKVLTSKSLKKRMMNNYQNGLLSTIILENTEINKGIKDDFRIIYGNENASFNKNEIIIQHILEPVEAEESAILVKEQKENTEPENLYQLKGFKYADDYNKTLELKNAINIIESIKYKTKFDTQTFKVEKIYVKEGFEQHFYQLIQYTSDGTRNIGYKLGGSNAVKPSVKGNIVTLEGDARYYQIGGDLDHVNNDLELSSESEANSFYNAFKTLHYTSEVYYDLLDKLK